MEQTAQASRNEDTRAISGVERLTAASCNGLGDLRTIAEMPFDRVSAPELPRRPKENV
jgi:hypothetical protein